MGFPHEAMVDMTGGVAEVLQISLLPRDLLAFFRHLLAKGALINCANCQVWGWKLDLGMDLLGLEKKVQQNMFTWKVYLRVVESCLAVPDSRWVDCVSLFCLQGALEQRDELGIMFRHAYSLTAVEEVNKNAY